VIAEKIRELIQKAVESLGLEAGDLRVEHPTDLKMGDYSTNVGIITGKAKEILTHLEAKLPSGVERVGLAGPGFINFYLSKEFFKKSLEEIIEKGDKFGKTENLKGQRFFIEHTQPNLFKEFHIGHLMNDIVGQAVSQIARANGALVKTACYHGDVGLHVAKAVWGIIKGERDPYSAGNKAYEENEEAKKEIQELNKKIYDRSDKEINEIYDEGRKESLDYLAPIYKRLDTQFDYSFFESESGNLGKELVLKFLEGGVFELGERGAVIFKGEKFGMHTRVFLNSDGLPTYEAKEIGLAKIKQQTFPFDQSITVTANEQDAFFNVVEMATGEVFPELKGKLKHLSHGMLRLPTGKMSSRTGDVITAEALIEAVKKRVKDDEAVAIGAIKYMILRQAIGNDIIFDLEKSVSTEGDSGVYLQYAYARTNSLLEKSSQKIDVNAPRENIHEIERLLYRFPEVVERAGREYAPHYIVTYLTELAGSFNNFYAHEQIIGDSPESPYRLAIVKAFNIVMKNGLTILGIPTPERI